MAHGGTGTPQGGHGVQVACGLDTGALPCGEAGGEAADMVAAGTDAHGRYRDFPCHCFAGMEIFATFAAETFMI